MMQHKEFEQCAKYEQDQLQAIEDARIEEIHAMDEADELSDDALNTWPEEISLQNGNDVLRIPDYDEVMRGEVTWHSEAIFEFDVKYIRADLVKKILDGLK